MFVKILECNCLKVGFLHKTNQDSRYSTWNLAENEDNRGKQLQIDDEIAERGKGFYNCIANEMNEM